ncbi:hypothetical protein ACFFRR_006874 [Megaselia abdita]
MEARDIIRFLLVAMLCLLLQVESASTKDDMMKSFMEKCSKGFSFTCMKADLVKFLDKIEDKKDIELFGGLSLGKDEGAVDVKNSEIITEISRSFPKDPAQRLNAYISTRISNFLQSRHLRLKFLNNEEMTETGRKGGGKLGKKGGMETLLAAGMMMKGMLMAIGMGAIAIMAGKALMTGVLALALSAIVGLKSLASGGGKSTTYEIVAKPVYSNSHSHSVSHEDHGHHSAYNGYGNYGRSMVVEDDNHLKEKRAAKNL